MGSTLASTQIRNTYTGLLKTTDNSAVTSSLKVITDGGGQDTALSISSTKIKANALELETVTEDQSKTNMVMWDSTSKALFYRTYNPTGINTVTASSITSPVNGAQLALDSTLINFEQGSNILITGSGSTVTIASTVTDSAQTVAFAAALDAGTPTGQDGDVSLSFTNYQSTTTVSRLKKGGGIQLLRVANSNGGIDATIKRDYAFIPVNASSQTTDFSSRTEIELDFLIDVGFMDGSAANSILTLPPPTLGRKIRIFIETAPVTYSRTVKIQIGGGTKYFYGKALIHHVDPSKGYKMASVGQSSGNKTTLNLDHAATTGGYIGDIIDITGIDSTYYHVNANLSKEFSAAAFATGDLTTFS